MIFILTLIEKDKEMQQMQDDFDVEAQKAYYEEKVQFEFEQNQKLTEKYEALNETFKELEDEYERLKYDYDASIGKRIIIERDL